MSKEEIFEDLKTMKQADVARKYNVTPVYISTLVKEMECQKYRKFYKIVKELFKREAIVIYTEMISKEELNTLENMDEN